LSYPLEAQFFILIVSIIAISNSHRIFYEKSQCVYSAHLSWDVEQFNHELTVNRVDDRTGPSITSCMLCAYTYKRYYDSYATILYKPLHIRTVSEYDLIKYAKQPTIHHIMILFSHKHSYCLIISSAWRTESRTHGQ
jgi:hypothetical protein